MTAEDGLRSAVAAGVIGSSEAFRALLNAVCEVSRQIFDAKASSIFLLDEETDELVFEAVGGYGEENLIGLRLPAGTGIVGWVLATRTPLILDDVQKDPRFAADFAKGTGYVPQGLMAVPLLHEEQALGVLEVLDRPQQSRFSLEEMGLLGLFANQAAIALDLLQRARRAEKVLASDEGELAVVARLASKVDGLEGARREASLRLLNALADTL
jgi:GAF domain-containing protein